MATCRQQMDSSAFARSSAVLWQTLGIVRLKSLIRCKVMPKRQIIFFHDFSVRKTEKFSAHYSGKKKQHTLKNNLMVNADSKVVFLTASYEGRIHDRIADMAGYSPPPGSVLYQDTGFQGFTCPGVKIMQPTKKPKGRDLTHQEKAKNREISSIRIRVEHHCWHQEIPHRQR